MTHHQRITLVVAMLLILALFLAIMIAQKVMGWFHAGAADDDRSDAYARRRQAEAANSFLGAVCATCTVGYVDRGENVCADCKRRGRDGAR